MFSVVPRVFEEFDPLPVTRWPDDLYRWPAVVNRYLAEPLSNFGQTEVHNTDHELRIRMDVHNFAPEEVKVTTDNKRITIHAKHEEKPDKYGYIKREICRSYKLPDNVNLKDMTSTMNDQGILNIRIGKKALEAPKEVPIPVEYKK